MTREEFNYPFSDLPRLTHFGYSDAEVSLHFGPHYHFGFELVFVTHGNASVRVLEQSDPVRLEPDDLIIMAPRVVHEFIYDYEDITFYWLGFQTEEEIAVTDTHLRSAIADVGQTDVRILRSIDDEIRTVAPTLGESRYRHYKHVPQFAGPFRQIREEIHLADRYASRMVYQRVLEIFTSVARLESRVEQVTHDTVLFAQAYVESHSWQPLDYDELSRKTGYSPAHLSRLFKSQYGVTPKQYHTRLRLRNAKIELSRGRSVGDVSHECGFASSSYFSSWFKQYTGVSPAAYAAGVLDHDESGGRCTTVSSKRVPEAR